MKGCTLLLAFLATVAVCAGTYQRFYSGRHFNKLPYEKNYCTPPIKAKYRNPAMNRKCYYAFSVCSNGHILLLPNTRSKLRKYSEPRFLLGLRGYPIIAAFWAQAQLKCGKTNRITYGQSNNRKLRHQIKNIVNDQHFSPQAIIWATYSNVHPLSGGRKTNQFQIILATHGTITYAIFIYRDMGWDQSCKKCARPIVGYTDGKGRGYQYCLPSNTARHLRHSIKIFRISDRHWSRRVPVVEEEVAASLEEALSQAETTEVKLQESDDYEDDDNDDGMVLSEEQNEAISEAWQDIVQDAADDDEDDEGNNEDDDDSKSMRVVDKNKDILNNKHHKGE